MSGKFNFLIETTKGLKKSQIKNITGKSGANKRKTYFYATEMHENKLRDLISNSLVNAKLEKHKEDNIAYIKKIKIYRGLRHRLGLPVRGQRTHTNARTNKRLKAKDTNLEYATNSKNKKSKKLVIKKPKKKLKTKVKK